MKITIIGVGKIKEAYFRDAIAEYSKRLSKFVCNGALHVRDWKIGMPKAKQNCIGNNLFSDVANYSR